MATNLVTTTPTRFQVIRPDLLPPMAVLQKIDTEQLISLRMQKLVEIWMANDPPNAAAYDVGALEFDPIRVNQELNAFFELLVRDRVNQAARAVTLAYAVGGDLDAIASRYPGGVPRLQWDAFGNVMTPAMLAANVQVASSESDAVYRQRIWLSPNILSLNGPGMGTFESYVFWALSAPMFLGDLPLRHASALTQPGTGKVFIPIMSSSPMNTTWVVSNDGNIWTLAPGLKPVPTATQIEAVYEYITEPNTARKGLTDIINVLPPKITPTMIDVRIWLFPGVDKTTLMTEIAAAVVSLIQAIQWLGADLTVLALQGALCQAGVYDTVIASPTVSAVAGIDGCVTISSVALRCMGTGE
jgi:phage-related baseplate assembly protein